jgi:uncharacterized integral membrane protein (TIGR02327 family)
MLYGSGIGSAWTAIFNLAFLLFGVVIAWYALGAVRWDVFLKNAKSRPAAVLRLLLAIALGYQLARFMGEYLVATSMLR